ALTDRQIPPLPRASLPAGTGRTSPRRTARSLEIPPTRAHLALKPWRRPLLRLLPRQREDWLRPRLSPRLYPKIPTLDSTPCLRPQPYSPPCLPALVWVSQELAVAESEW